MELLQCYEEWAYNVLLPGNCVNLHLANGTMPDAYLDNFAGITSQVNQKN